MDKGGLHCCACDSDVVGAEVSAVIQIQFCGHAEGKHGVAQYGFDIGGVLGEISCLPQTA